MLFFTAEDTYRSVSAGACKETESAGEDCYEQSTTQWTRPRQCRRSIQKACYVEHGRQGFGREYIDIFVKRQKTPIREIATELKSDVQLRSRLESNLQCVKDTLARAVRDKVRSFCRWLWLVVWYLLLLSSYFSSYTCTWRYSFQHVISLMPF